MLMYIFRGVENFDISTADISDIDLTNDLFHIHFHSIILQIFVYFDGEKKTSFYILINNARSKVNT